MSHAASVARSTARGVAADVAEIGRRGPAAGALETDDARRSITFEPSELAPWMVRFDFLVYYVHDDESDEHFYEYVVVGYELAKPIAIRHANAEPDRAARLFPAISARFAADVATYCRQAELLLRQERHELEEVRQALRAGRAHKYHPLLVAVYRAWSVKGALFLCGPAGVRACDVRLEQPLARTARDAGVGQCSGMTLSCAARRYGSAAA